MEINPGDIIRLKKKHPCGSYEWRVTRVGSDIGLECMVCHRHVMLARTTLERRYRGHAGGEK